MQGDLVIERKFWLRNIKKFIFNDFLFIHKKGKHCCVIKNCSWATFLRSDESLHVRGTLLPNLVSAKLVYSS